jgi:hypothetical protein
MADRLPEPLRVWWKDDVPEGTEGVYGFLSTFAHPRNRLAKSMVNPDSGTVKLGPDYDATLFVATAHYLTGVGIKTFEFMARLLGPEHPMNDLQDAIRDATELLAKLNQDALDMMDIP